MKRIKPGETFEHQGNTYVAIARTGCKGCAFKDTACAVVGEIPECSSTSWTKSLQFVTVPEAIALKLTGEIPS